jgi:ribosome-binding factor A
VSERRARLDELLREEISSILGRAHDPGIGFVTVTGVDVSPDLRNATVWVSTIGQPEERKETLRALHRSMPFVRRELRVLRLRRIPELQVKVDDTVERGTRVLEILRGLEEGHEPPAPNPIDTLPTPGPARTVSDEEGDAEPLTQARGSRRRPATRQASGRSAPQRRRGSSR